MQGTTFEAINSDDIESVVLTIPKSIVEQKKITSILQNIDYAIEKTKELIEKHRMMKHGLMQDLFTKGIDENGRMHQHLKNSELGQIPEKWSILKIGDIYKNLRTGSTPSRRYPEYFKGDILWVTSGELKYKLITDTIEKITEKAVRDTNLKIYPAGTFFIAITGLEAEGTLGSCGIIGKPAATNQSCMAFERNEMMDTGFLFQYYCYYGKNLIYKYAQGTKQQSLNRRIVEAIPIKVPPTIDEQKRIAEILYRVDKKIYSEEDYMNKLIRMKAGLMQDLLTGKVRVAA
jgi:type I restriction enzyme S subunit